MERQRLALTDLILCEVLQGILNRPSSQELEKTFWGSKKVFSSRGVGLAIEQLKNIGLYTASWLQRFQNDRLLDRYFLFENSHQLLHGDRNSMLFRKGAGTGHENRPIAVVSPPAPVISRPRTHMQRAES